MEGSVSYAAWLAESARITRMARTIAQDERLTSALAQYNLMVSEKVPALPLPRQRQSLAVQTAVSPSPSSFASKTCPEVWHEGSWLVQLLALAELPPPKHVVSSSTSSCIGASPRSFAPILSEVLRCCSGDRNGPDGSAAAVSFAEEALSSVTYSHQLLPTTRGTLSAPSRTPAAPMSSTSTGPPVPTSVGGGVALQAEAMDEDYDGAFARLKLQAAERHRVGSAHHPVPPHRLPCTNASGSACVAPSAPASAGLSAARAALDAIDTLLLRLRLQSGVGTSASSRLTEAQGRLLRATVCREAQLYADRILGVVSDVLPPTHLGRSCRERNAQGSSSGSGHEEDDADEEGTSSAVSGMRSRHCRSAVRCLPFAQNTIYAERRKWADLLATGSRSRLLDFIEDELSAAQGPSARRSSRHQPSGVDGTSVERQPSLSHSSLTAFAGSSQPLHSPISREASMLSGIAAPRPLRPLSASAAASAPTPVPLIPCRLATVLMEWRQVVESQQRALRLQEVQDYVSAARLFLLAALEEQQLGGGEASDAGSAPRSRGPQGPTATTSGHPCSLGTLVTHGVTHMLRACGILLSDMVMSSEVLYPLSLVEELVDAATETAYVKSEEQPAVPASHCNTRATQENVSSADAVLSIHASDEPLLTLPPLPCRGCPHIPRVWLLLVELVTFLERTGLQLPWDGDVAAEATAAPTLASLNHLTSHCSRCGTLHNLWELSAAVLLFHPVEALQVVREVLQFTTLAPASATNTVREQGPSLRELFKAHLYPPVVPPAQADAAASGEPPASPSFPTSGSIPRCLFSATPPATARAALKEVQVAPGMLRSCLLSLRRAVAAAVRAQDYADALFDVEAGQHLLRRHLHLAEADLPESEGDGSGTPKNVEVESASTGILEVNPNRAGACPPPYHRIVCWPRGARPSTSGNELSSTFMDGAALQASQTCFTVRVPVAATITHLPDAVFFLVMRVLLLMSTMPMACGEAAARQKQSHGRTSRGDTAAKEDLPEGEKPVSRTPATLQRDDVQEAVDSTNDVATSLIDAFCILQRIADQLRVVEEDAVLPRESVKRIRQATQRATEKRSSATAQEAGSPCSLGDVRLLTTLPAAPHRLQSVLSAATAAMGDKGGSDAQPPNTPMSVPRGGEQGVRGSPAEMLLRRESHRAPSSCTLTSGERYRQLQKFHRQTRAHELAAGKAMPPCRGVETPPPAHQDAAEREDNGVTEKTTLEGLRTATSSSVPAKLPPSLRPQKRCSGAEDSDGMKEIGNRPFHWQWEAVVELSAVLRELWTVVETLTLPLRAASTCIEAPASEVMSTICGEAAEAADPGTKVAEETEAATPLDKPTRAYCLARMALPSFEPRMERCLRELGALDRAMLVVVRRLQAQLLFPISCSPLT